MRRMKGIAGRLLLTILACRLASALLTCARPLEAGAAERARWHFAFPQRARHGQRRFPGAQVLADTNSAHSLRSNRLRTQYASPP